MATTPSNDAALDLFDLFKSNKINEEDGIWFELNSVTAFKVRAYGSKAVMDKRDALLKPYQVMQRAGAKIPEDVNEEIGLKVVAGAVIADWKGVNNADKEPVKYTADEAFAILKALPKLFSTIVQWSTDTQAYQDVAVEDGSKNS